MEVEGSNKIIIQLIYKKETSNEGIFSTTEGALLFLNSGLFELLIFFSNIKAHIYTI